MPPGEAKASGWSHRKNRQIEICWQRCHVHFLRNKETTTALGNYAGCMTAVTLSKPRRAWRPTRVVRILSNEQNWLRLIRALAVETHENWTKRIAIWIWIYWRNTKNKNWWGLQSSAAVSYPCSAPRYSWAPIAKPVPLLSCAHIPWKKLLNPTHATQKNKQSAIIKNHFKQLNIPIKGNVCII